MNWILKLKQFVKKFASREVPQKVETIEKLPRREKINHAPVIQAGYVLDSCTIRYFDEYECVGLVLKNMSEKMPYHITSVNRREIQHRGRLHNARLIKIDFDSVISRFEKILGTKINYNEISPEIQNTAKILRQSLLHYRNKNGKPLLHSGDDEILAFTLMTKSTLITSDKGLIKCCKIIDCKYIDLHIEMQESRLVFALPYEFVKHSQKNRRYRGQRIV